MVRQQTPDIMGDVLAGKTEPVVAQQEYRMVGLLRPHPDNEVIYGDRADSDLIESVKRLGVRDPILITGDNLIISGHRRWGAAIAAGLTHVPVIVSDAKDDLDIGDLLVELNRNREKTAEQKIREANYRAENIRRRQSRRGQRTDLTSVSIETEVRPPTAIAAEEVGLGRTTYQRGKVVVDQIDALRANGKESEADALRDELNRSVSGAYNQVATDRPRNDLTEEETQAFLRRYFHASTLANFAKAPDPREAARRYMVDHGSGFWGNDWKYDTRAGKVEVWDIVHHGEVTISRDPLVQREPDAIFTYERLAKLAMDLLPATSASDPLPTAPTSLAGLIDCTDQLSPWLRAAGYTIWARYDDGRMVAAGAYAPATQVGQNSMGGAADSTAQPIEWCQADYMRRNLPDPQPARPVTPAAPLPIAIKPALAVDGDRPLPDWAAEPEPAPVPVSQREDYDSDEWYTPIEYLWAAREVMGDIALDPASSELAQTVVHAKAYFTKADNGLAMARWLGETIWLNPPYSNPAVWVDRLIKEFQTGIFIKHAIILVNNSTETTWFQSLLERYPVCLPAKRLAFWRHDQDGVTARQGQACFYLGADVDKFVEVFGKFGPVLRRLS